MAKRRKERRPPDTARPRSCGECRACCVTLGFQARDGEAPFEKPAGVSCPHVIPLGSLGCRIYEERPPVCRRFQCGWLQAPHLPEELRPDRSGVLLVLNDALCGEGQFLYVYELRPGAAAARLPARLIREWAARITVLIVRAGGCEVLTADPEIQARLESGAFSAESGLPGLTRSQGGGS